MKKCKVCGEEKSADEFYKGHARCKTCYKAKVKRNREENADHYREYDRKRANLPHRVEARKQYAKTEKGIEARNRARKSWLKRNPIKRMANVIVGNAVRDGKLLKPSACESCGIKPKRLHGHHDDYAFPLSVRWLCPGCHNKWHKENGEGANAF
jgi:hypothetical protein